MNYIGALQDSPIPFSLENKKQPLPLQNKTKTKNEKILNNNLHNDVYRYRFVSTGASGTTYRNGRRMYAYITGSAKDIR